jgi:hypothetical protein
MQVSLGISSNNENIFTEDQTNLDENRNINPKNLKINSYSPLKLDILNNLEQ